MKKIAEFIEVYSIYFIVFGLAFVSFISFFIFFQDGQNLLYGDALSRMNIARKIIDNLTPGLAQLGNVWLPLPQLLMLPLIWNSDLWHSGIAGAFMSMTAFIIGGIYLYKSLKILTNSFLSSIIALSIYAININILYLQTTAMSETLFLCTLCATIYYFLLYIKKQNNMYLLPAGIAVSAMSLTRYEALAILPASILLVIVYTWFKNRKKVESSTILYATLACLGFVLWTIYLAVIFGDPLYWKNYYTGAPSETVGMTVVRPNFFEAFWKYFTAVVWMNGLIPTLLAVLSIPFIVFYSLKKKSFYFLPVILSLSICFFMILTLQRNTPIHQPELTLANLMLPQTNYFLEFNIRYGILMLPFIVLACSYLLMTRFVVFKLLILFLLVIQFSMYFYPKYTLIYQLPISISANTTQGTQKDKELIVWLKEHYDQGLIMISALKHDPQMLQLGVDYKTYIHEGTGKYWRVSKKDPQKYATWVIFDKNNKSDQVTKYLSGSRNLEIYYDLVYDKDGMVVYKIKTKPEMEIK